MEFFPKVPCVLGQASLSDKDPEKGCPWYVNSQEDNYCFWTWVRKVSDKDGFFEPLLQHEMSTLLDMSSTKIHAIFKDTVEFIKNSDELAAIFESLQD